MELAKQQFGIPQVLSAEHLSSRELDELSCMTYLSYFMKVDSPGYDETLRWVRQQLPTYNVRNFQVTRLKMKSIYRTSTPPYFSLESDVGQTT